MTDDYALSLNASSLLFFPPQREDSEDRVAPDVKEHGYMRSELSGERFYVAQVIVKIEKLDLRKCISLTDLVISHSRNTMKETLLFYRFQREITVSVTESQFKRC